MRREDEGDGSAAEGGRARELDGEGFGEQPLAGTEDDRVDDEAAILRRRGQACSASVPSPRLSGTVARVEASLFARPDVELRTMSDGGWLMASRLPLGEYERSIGEMLPRGADRHPGRRLIAERDSAGAWREVTYGQARQGADAIAQALLERGLGPDRPAAALSGNSIDHALLMLGCFTARVPLAPISAAYSLQSHDFAKLRQVLQIAAPALVYVSDCAVFAKALAVVGPAVEVVASSPAPDATPFRDLLETTPGALAERAFASVGPDDVAKVMFTSGSTGEPKGVITTHRMLCANQQAMAQAWPFLEASPPVLLDWLPWSHTFGGSHDFNLVLRNGGTLYIDEGRPVPGPLATTIKNLREVSPTLYFNVPAGFAALLPELERDPSLAAASFARLRLIFYAGASLSRDIWKRLEILARRFDADVAMTTAWGATETAPAATAAHFPLDGPGNVGVPLPGTEIKLTPVGAKLELRVRGPSVTPGYVGRADLTSAAFDEEGFYRTGDAGKLIDAGDANRGILFAGRIAEEFKLSTGTWVSAGTVRTAALAAVDGLLQDAVVTGHDRGFLALLAWVNASAAKRILPTGLDAADPVAVAGCSAVVDALRRGLASHNAAAGGSSARIHRVLLLTEPPSLDDGEITDKGYIKQRAVLDRRVADVNRLYVQECPPDVIEISSTQGVNA